jgi:hypothetical protein
MNRPLKTILITAWLLGFSVSTQLQAQSSETATPPPSPCETDTGFDDFDFWVGEWKVYSNDKKRTLQGTNSINKHHKNCLIIENWTNLQGGTGSSMNYYDPVEDQWRQLWVAGGYSIDYTGGLDETGSMVLNGRINYYKTGESHAFRGRWTPNTDGSVRQFFEQQDNKSLEWKVWFDGLYIKSAGE